MLANSIVMVCLLFIPRSLGYSTTCRAFTSSSSSSWAFRRTAPTMMPEGPEVRTIATSIDAQLKKTPSRLVSVDCLSGRYVRHGPPANHGNFLSSLQLHPDSSEIKAWKCRGKFQYLLLSDEQRSIWVTLGMSGRFSFDADLNHKHSRVNFVLEDLETRAKRNLTFIDARNFGTVRFSLDRQELEDKLKTLGPDLLDEGELTDEVFLQVARKSCVAAKSPLNVCVFLMNQKKISGVGNYILAEGLHKANVDPWATLDEIDDLTLISLIRHLRETAMRSFDAQGLTRQKGGSYRSLSGSSGKFEFELMVYGRSETPSNEPVYKVIDGPHKRAIHFTMSQISPERWEYVAERAGLSKRR
mmetsp:Transcript_13552/g.26922  ORF Transcript_13552/g.26922 Transcript_13552/m.26922 type:complete len:357 (-) Transcript_13552:23-1093(-)